MATHENKLLGQLIEWLGEQSGETAEWYAEELVVYRADIERRDAIEEEAYAKGLAQGEARAWNAMRNFVAMRGDDARLTSTDLMERLTDKILAISGDAESAIENVDNLNKVLARRVAAKFQ